MCRRKIAHGKVGGVTNATCHIGIYFRAARVDLTSSLGKRLDKRRPRRYLRSVLKMAVGGHRCGTLSPALASALVIGTHVKEVRAGVVLNSGLLGIKTNGGLLRLPRVKTLFGGDMWVIRVLTPSEVLACWDVPEKLGQLTKTDDGKRSLMRVMFTPIKIRQAILEDLFPFMPGLLGKENGQVGLLEKKLVVLPRGPRLQTITVAEEHEIIKDESNPPTNLLIEQSKAACKEEGGMDLTTERKPQWRTYLWVPQ
jgi:hypothetical protein